MAVMSEVDTEFVWVPTRKLPSIYALCPNCFNEIEAWYDPGDGVWIECACDAGYVTRKSIRVIIPEE